MLTWNNESYRRLVRTLGLVISPLHGRYPHKTTQIQKKRGQTSLCALGFEPRIPLFQWVKKFRASVTGDTFHLHTVTDLINALPDSSSVNTVHYATIEEAVFSMSPAPSNSRNRVFCDQILGYATVLQ
jgi:hypothetical protein